MTSTTSIRIFIVEDEALIAMELQDRLGALNYTVCGLVARGEDLLEQVAQARTDLVLLGSRLAGDLDGLQTAAILRDRHEVVVVLLSAFSDDELIKRANEVGVAGFLFKPIRERELHATLQTAWSRACMERRLREANERQDEQRRFNQATLDAVAARLAVLDLDGQVLAANSAWIRFSKARGSGWESTAIGQNYLAACDEAHGDCADEAPLVANCVRVVLQGRELASSVEYPCQTSDGQRWYLCNVTRFADSNPIKVVVQHDDITASHKVRTALYAQERVFDGLAASSPVGIYCVDPTGQCEYFNDRAHEITGLPVGEALGVGWVAAVHPDDRERILAARTLVLNGAPPLHIELRFLRPDGSVSWALVQSANLLDASGHISGYVGTLTDITEQKLVEMAMTAISTELINLEGDAFYEAALARLCELLDVELAAAGRPDHGVSPEVHLLAVLKGGEFSPWTTYAEKLEPCSQVASGDSIMIPRGASRMHASNPFLAEIGAEFYCGEPLLARNGDVLGTLCVAGRRPVRNGQLVERILKLFNLAFARTLERERAGRRFEALLEFAPSGLVMIEPSGIVVVMNREAERIFGWSRDEVIGQPVEMLVPERRRAQHIEQRQAFAAREENSQISLSRPRQWGLRKDGTEFPTEICLSPIDTQDGLLFAAAIRDVTSRQALEQKVAYGQKMEAIGELAGGIAHDFNNLLTAINGFSYMLSQCVDVDSPEGGMVEQIMRAGERAASLTRELLTFSRRHIDHPRIVNMNDLVTEAETMLRFLLGETSKLELELDLAIGSIKVDPAQLEQVIVNLVLNARDAMLAGGLVKISSRVETLDPSQTKHLPGLQPGAHVVLEVSDSGCGIEQPVLNHIFEPFYTTKGRANGTGLGLAVVYGIVKQAGGSIDVTSVVGEGSAFLVYLPMVHSDDELQRVLIPQAPAQLAQGTVLIVDDEAAVRSLAQMVLESVGYDVLLAATGEEALNRLEQACAPVDVLLTDVILPGISGRQVADAFCQGNPDAKVLFMSGYAVEKLDGYDIPIHESDLLEKPFGPPELLSALEKLLTRSLA